VVGALYLDGGFAGARSFILDVMADIVAATGAGAVRSPKTVLQEWAQGQSLPLPTYRIVETTGPEHSRTFVVEVDLGALHARGTGRSKRDAQENAAQALLETV
jgi:ribonuclease-3